MGAEGTLVTTPFRRHVNSVFTEVQVITVGNDNKLIGVEALDFSLSGRCGKYSDFGDTFNPNIGLGYKPVSCFTLRGNWDEFFNAPTPVDQIGSLRNTLIIRNFLTVSPPGQPDAIPGQYAIALAGSATQLQPRTAMTHSIGSDIDLNFVPGLRASFSYYHIDFNGTLGKAPVLNAQQLYDNFPGFVTLNPSAAQIAAYGMLAAGADGVTQVAAYVANPANMYQLLDFRSTNLGYSRSRGIDVSLNYDHDTSLGSIDAGAGSSYRLKSETQAGPTAPSTDDIESGASRLTAATTLGANIKYFRAQATWDYSAGYHVQRASTLQQHSVDAFNTGHLFFKYDVNGTEGLTKDLSLNLNVTNLFDKDHLHIDWTVMLAMPMVERWED